MLAFLALVFFFTLLMLIKPLLAAQDRGRAPPPTYRRRSGDGARGCRRVRWFMLIRTVVGVVSGLAATTWLWLLGVDFAPFWGVLFFLLNYLPNIGSIIAGIRRPCSHSSSSVSAGACSRPVA